VNRTTGQSKPEDVKESPHHACVTVGSNLWVQGPAERTEYMLTDEQHGVMAWHGPGIPSANRNTF
jgi:hypothetical protein